MKKKYETRLRFPTGTSCTLKEKKVTLELKKNNFKKHT